MNAEIVNGQLVLSISSPTELYAIEKWLESAEVRVADLVRNEVSYVRGSSIKIVRNPEWK